MVYAGASKELMTIRWAATCLRVGTPPPYRLRKQGKCMKLLVKPALEKVETHEPDRPE